MKKPSSDEMRTAAEWLDCYEDQDGDSNGGQCRRVAEWLRAQAEKMEFEAVVQEAAKQHKLPVARVRQAIRQQMKKAS